MSEQQNPNWERQVLENLVLATLKEQRKSRNWRIFFRFVGFTWLFLLLAMIVTWHNAKATEAKSTGPHTALIDVKGVIAAGGEVDADSVMEGLRNAFKDRNTKGVVLRINSPGGSPVQAGQIADEIRRLRKLNPTIPLYVVVDDICASGGYYVAAAADKIYVDKASLVGSIGVLMDGFGFTGTMEKLGVERRLITAGENKGFLDPFSPQSTTQLDYAHKMLDEVHQQFIKVVRDGRGKRLKETPDMFSGLVWSGEKSIELGLADGFGNADKVAREVVKAEDIVDFTPRDDWTQRFARTLGASAGAQLGSSFNLRLK
ncbi:S49 family peptidase [Chitinimonas sp. BJB300]|uniref:S49 family peptidase n=1 Tax=Chitinimonas sp. BJB300 TaxID=1559339 RepID=UPI000C0F0FB2|nr:S49 family peptidase [Chitinimonas sp. BJB300]PHV13011.1 S49 family peptidase [Chitinimonas sp. BJB300]TSJ88932.1 S49 family peptidase [Chitinimonas sp. BJB300]